MAVWRYVVLAVLAVLDTLDALGALDILAALDILDALAVLDSFPPIPISEFPSTTGLNETVAREANEIV